MAHIIRLATAFTLALTTAAAAQDVTIETATGPVTLPAQPQTVVALDIAALDTLDALGVQIAGIPAPHFVTYLDDVAAQAQNVGSLFEPDFEALANMAPDLIVAGGRSSRQVDALSEVGTTIDMTIYGDDHVAAALARLDAYGTLMGLEGEADAVEADFNAKLDAARAAVADQGDALIVMTNGPTVSAFGAGSRFGWIHQALDLPEAVEGVDQQTHGEAISFEFIAEANPDWLIVVDRSSAIGQPADAASQTLDNALVAQTTAWQQGQVIYLTSANVYIAGGGIQSMGMTLDEVTAAFGG
ncbi:iron complex transport system substrate-binding protein [Monaibacterium marinum]|uniref:Iron complex transport system substrate-binding protein n=1 Tax=Pontivivens marinum TaxID=1690039 RepID=A0A2C9CSZ6_9RHOB|nr:siderophore ABC transporter substrate-binding protein [Monaibacterium marinum]SOH94343.1 iron complex transport system substrate-binding protein [Monaibacterium marinum]